MINQEKKYELIKFEDGEFSLDVNVSPSEDTVWLTQQQISLLFDKARSTIAEHILNIFKDLELDANSVCRKNRQTGSDAKTYEITLYNLDVILAVGYRVKSKRGILFRRWASSVLKNYLINGYSINEKRCLECSENIISLNNKVSKLIDKEYRLENRVKALEETDSLLKDKLFFENKIYEAYSYIKQLLYSSKQSLIIIDSYIDLSVLDMLNEINIPIIIYTLPSAPLTNQDINKFSLSHNINIIRTNKIHDRFLIIDDAIYSIGSSLKDIGKKRFVMIKLESIKKEELLLNL